MFRVATVEVKESERECLSYLEETEGFTKIILIALQILCFV